MGLMNNRPKIANKFALFLKGLAMGTANKVPGVSGGAVAFVLGFYEELIYTFQKINTKALKLLLNGRFKSLFAYLNMSFLILVMGGSLFSYFSVSILLDYFLRHYELYVWSSFFGMIIGSVYYIGKKYDSWNFKNSLFVLLGIAIGLALSFMPPAKENSNLWFVFFCGVVGVSGMTLPGLSGSFILMLLGNYVLLLVVTVNVVFRVFMSLLTGDFHVLEIPSNIQYLKIAGTFFVGSFFGLVSFSHVLSYVLKRWSSIVTALIIGFISGSLGIVWPWKKSVYVKENDLIHYGLEGEMILENYKRYVPKANDIETWIAIGFIFLGIAIVVGIDMYELKKKRTVQKLQHKKDPFRVA
jgi:putative membrane protein